MIGAGPFGLAVAAELADAGRRVEVVDDGIDPGGSLLALGPSGVLGEAQPRCAAALDRPEVAVSSATVAGAVFPDGILTVGPDATELLTPRATVFAPGAHDGVLPFENNDLPGIFSARAGLKLLSAGIAVGARVVVAVAEGAGPYGAIFRDEVARLGAPVEVILVQGTPTAASGSGVRFASQFLKADALLVDAPRAPAFELCAQAGAELTHTPAGFAVRAPRGRIRKGNYALGEVTGAPISPARVLEDAASVARAVLQDG